MKNIGMVTFGAKGKFGKFTPIITIHGNGMDSVFTSNRTFNSLDECREFSSVVFKILCDTEKIELTTYGGSRDNELHN